MQVGRSVECGCEAPDRTNYALWAAVVAFFNSPEIVGVVEEVADGEAFSQVACPVNQNVFAVVGAAEKETVFGGVRAEAPLQGD